MLELSAVSRCSVHDSISRATVQNIRNMHVMPPATLPTASLQLPILWKLHHTCIASAAASSTKIWEATRSSLTRWRMMRMISRSLVDLQRDSGGSRATTTLAGSTAPKSPRHSAHSCWAFQLVGVWICSKHQLCLGSQPSSSPTLCDNEALSLSDLHMSDSDGV